ncbi:MAG: SUF system NifU family Fe-S cluster assembly protein [Polyangiaceae bacterium UTPRO1]|jgi:nitrogen fixation NifU-like protein|nr:SUF system NifU family Fe-S cluster assembly protein [Myxococcales bacterium]OQY67039.1 MAG: SUF system NifU family Fe-S cluster assembly protein [Polyangiaceae bacterium UTPRO1]
MSAAPGLYRDVVLEHGRRPRNVGPLASATHAAEGDNPLCGDSVRVEVERRGDVLARLAFAGESCILATASASLMTEELRGAHVDEARRRAAAMEALCSDGRGAADALGPLAAFADVHRHPARIACALLPWRTLVRALGD